jgi:cobalt-zinc-cadmium efflux system protein
MHHNHQHNKNEGNIKAAFFLNFGFAIIEAFGGYLTNSIAIMADALHDLGDSISLLMSWQLERLSNRSSNTRYSYGYKRYSLLGALLGSMILIGGIVVVAFESIKRLQNPQPTNAQGMLLLSITGIAVNGFAAIKAGKGNNLNSRMIYWHMLEDALGWAAVLVVSIVLMFVDIPVLDPILSLAISGFILFNVIRNLKQTADLFLQGVPLGIDIRDIEQAVLTDDKVVGIHHTHIWSLDGEHHVLTSHVVLDESTKKEDIRRVKEIFRGLAGDFHLAHTTIEFEYVESDCSMNNNILEDLNE